jgi:hypothetical protein
MLKASVVAASLLAATAQAAVLDFDATSVSQLANTNLPSPFNLVDVFHGTSYTEDGFVLTSTPGTLSYHTLFVPDADNALFVDAASSYAMGSSARSITTLTAANNSAFTLASIDIAKQLVFGGTIVFHGVKADNSGEVLAQFNYNGNWSTKNFTNFTNLSSVYWTQGGLVNAKVQWDNINVTAVPEPETYAMLLAGLGLVGWARRRKQA